MGNLRNIFFGLLILTFLMMPISASAQEETEGIDLSVVKLFGYRVGNTIQGRFGLRISGPDDLNRVEFYIDDEILFQDEEAPFQYNFDTGETITGKHTIKAIGYTQDGRILSSEIGTYTILTADEASEGLQKFMIPLLIGVVVLMVTAGVLSILMTRRKPQTYRIGEYGPAGGAVCGRCGIPFSRHFISPNLLVGKLERCPNCGAIAIVRRATSMELEAAEQRLLAVMQKGKGGLEEDDEEKNRRMLDASRFEL